MQRDTSGDNRESNLDGLLDEQQHRDLSKRGNPAEGEWPDPSDYANPNDFIGQQLIEIANGRGNVQSGRYNPILVPHGSTMNGVSDENAGMTTANHILFRSRVAAIALQGLYGCTSVVVVSRRGAWVSHIWERDMGWEKSFQDKVIGKDDDEDGPSIRRGFKETNRDFRVFTHGLEDMVENVEDRCSGFTFGDVLPDAREQGDTTNKTPKDLNTRAYIFTPRHRFNRYRDGKLIPEFEFLDNIDLNRGRISNGLLVARLSGFISDIYGGIDVDVVDYMAGTPRGKLLLRYKPAKTCNDKAAWRLWIENQGVGRRSDEWTPERGQIFRPADEDSDSDSDDDYDSDDIYGSVSGLARRQEACPMPSTKTAGTATKTPVTSQAMSSTQQQTPTPPIVTNSINRNSTQPGPTPTVSGTGSRSRPLPTAHPGNQTATVPGKPASTSTPEAGVVILYELDFGAGEGGDRTGQWQVF
ncbi:hypothetical protein CMUS01_15731 [Colletotrichum musicola]|uniref:Uncharacterized protein n=1 Tax=Colletotrichum musicola TaxID=2175873 RepID=A0A8H6IUV8_9PEZI|nr:hypothetical protein CMUS01_15731 [Colletotrichum musicola]